MKQIGSCATSALLTTFGSVAPANTGAFGGRPFYVNLATGETWALTGSTFVKIDVGSFAGPAPAPPAASNGLLAELIAQQQAHEVWPFIANQNGGGYREAPFKIADMTVGAANFSMLGSTLMPNESWFQPSNRAELAPLFWRRIDPWWVIFNRRASKAATTNANTNPNAAVKISNHQLLIYRGGGVWDAPYAAGTAWAGSYLNDFTSSVAGASYRIDGNGAYICKCSADGTKVIHGGGFGPTDIPNPSTVRGIFYRLEAQAVDYNTGAPLDGAMVGVYTGADPLPYPNRNANNSFTGYNWAPGAGCSAFIAARSTPRFSMFSTMTTAQLNANPPPGYN